MQLLFRKKVLPIVLIFAFCLTLLQGCSAKAKVNKTSSSKSSTVISSGASSETSSVSDSSLVSSQSSASSAVSNQSKATQSTAPTTQNLINDTYTTGYPIVKNKITLNIMIDKEAVTGDFDTMKFTTEYEKKTNVHINWTIVQPTERAQQKSLALMSGNLPDIMALVDAFTPADIITYGGQGLLQSVDGLIPKWAPNVQKAINSDTRVKSAITAPDGHIYSVPLVDSVVDEQMFSDKVFINKTWLDNLNLQMPTTYAELLNVLRAFKSGDPNGNGQADEIPLACTGFDPALAGAPQGINWYWDSDRMYVDSNNKIQYFMASDAYRDSIKFFATCWSENLMDQNVFTGKTAVATRTLKGNVGVFVAANGVLSLSEADMKNYVIMPPIKSTASSQQTVVARNRNFIQPFSYVLTAKDKYPEASLRWVDYFFTKEGYIFEQYGPADGGFYNTLSTGKIQVVKGKTDSDRYKLAPGFVLPSWYTSDVVNYIQKPAASDMTISDKFFNDIDSTQAMSLYTPFVQKKYVPNLFFSKSDSDKILNLADPIHSYAFNTGMAFVNGQANVDTGWNDYLAQLNKLNVSQLVGIYQTAYNNYKW